MPDLKVSPSFPLKSRRYYLTKADGGGGPDSSVADNGEMHSGENMPTQLHGREAAFTALHDREVPSDCTSVP
jgi:hypothetical protein